MATFIPLSPFPVQFQHSTTSANLNAGELTFFLSGTSTPTNMFSDSSGTSIGTSILLNSAGYPESGGNVITLFRDTSISYKIVLKLTAGGSVVFTANTLNSELTLLGSTTNSQGASMVALEDTANNFSTDNVEAALAQTYSDSLQNVVEDTTPQLGGTLDCLDKIIQKAEMLDYSIAHQSVSSVSGVLTIDFELGNSVDVMLTEDVTSVVLENPPPTGRRGRLEIDFLQDSTGSWTVGGWPAAVKWPGGTAPTITATADTGTDTVILTTREAGTEYRGAFDQDYS